MTFRTVFDLASEGYRTWWFSIPGLIPLVAAAIFLRAAPPDTRRERATAALAIAVCGVASALWIATTLPSTYDEYKNLRNRLQAGRYRVVEGRVTEFYPNDGGHRGERWTVNGTKYVVQSSVVTSAFNTPGLVHEGDSVRIADVDGAIARIAVFH